MFISNIFRVALTLYKNNKAKTYYRLAFIALMLLVGSQVQAAAQFISAPGTSNNGVYTLSWGGAVAFTSIREKFGASGAWVMLSDPPGSDNPDHKKFPPSFYSMNITRTVPGTYYYELWDCYFRGGPPNGNPACNVTATHAVTVSFAPLSVTASFSPTTINEGGSATLTWSSQNATSCSATGISGVSGASGSVPYAAPTVMNANQTVNIPVTCTAGGSNQTATASVNVNWVNDAPTIAAIANLTINEDTSSGAIGFSVGDEETAAASLDVTVSSSNSQIPATVGGSDANRNVTITPVANAWGQATIKVRVTDAHGGFAEREFTVTVNAVNDAPTISDIPHVTINENQTTGARSFTVNDIDTPMNQWDVSIVSSSNTTLIPLANIQLDGSGTARTIQTTPLPNKFGSSVITVKMSDGSLSVIDTFTVTVNDLPATFTSIPATSANGSVAMSWDYARDHVGIRVSDSAGNWTTVIHPAAASGSYTDTRPQTGTYTYQLQDCYYTGGGPNGNPICTPTDNRVVVVALPAPEVTASLSPTTINEGGTATLTWSSTNTTSCSATGISGVSATSGSVTYTAPTVMSANQPVNIPVTCSGGGGSKTATASVNVNWVNDKPALTIAPSIAATEDTVFTIPYTVSDEETAVASLSVTAVASDASKIQSIVVSGANLTITPVAHANGNVSITVRVTDAHGSYEEKVVSVAIAAVDDAPVISAINNVTINEKGSTTFNFSVTDVDSSVSGVSVSAGSGSIVTPVLSGSGNSYSLELKAGSISTAASSVATTITVSAPFSPAPVTRSFTATVNNLPATFTNIPTTSSNGAVSFSWDYARDHVGIRVRDSAGNWSTVIHPAAASGSYTDTRTLNGTYTYELQDCYYAGGAPNGNPTCAATDTRTVVVAYPVPVITASFSPATISESPASGAANTAVLTWSATNAQSCSATGISGVSGTSGSVTYTALPVMTTNQALDAVITCIGQGPSSVSKTASLTINAVNDLPTISAIADQSIQEDQVNGTGNIGFTVGDEETAVNSLTVTAVSSNQSLIPDANLVRGGSGANRTIKATPLPNMFGSATITLTVSDGQASSTQSFVVNVASVNDQPTLAIPANERIDKNTSSGTRTITVGDIETAAASLTVTAVSDRPDIIAESGLVLGGSGANRTIKMTPLAGKTGLVLITINVSDGQLVTSKAFRLSVQETFAAPFDFNSETPAEFNYSLTNSAIPGLGTNQFMATTQGKLNAANGVASYSIPIELPPAVRDLKPNLALTYNSRSGNGLMGVGWNLSGLSAITRCRTSFATESTEAQKSNPRYSIGDRLCLDGQKLVVASSATASNDSAYWATGVDLEYKTELDNFAKIVAYGLSANGGHGYFKVWTKDGRILTYGAEDHSQASKIYATNQSAGPVKTWALDKVEDAYGNAYTITYERDITTGEHYPLQINLGTIGSVVFSYQSRTGQTPWGYDVGNKYQFTKVLDKVTTYLDTTQTTPIKQYDVDYKISATTNRELVDKIVECGYESGTQKCARPLTFDWQQGELGFAQTYTPVTLSDGSKIGLAEFGRFEDVNADGYVDIVGKYKILAWGNASGIFTPSGYSANDLLPSGYPPGGVKPLTFITTKQTKKALQLATKVTESTTSGPIETHDIYLVTFSSGSTTVTRTLIDSVTEESPFPFTLLTGDFNNDGLDDFTLGGDIWAQNNTAGATSFTKKSPGGKNIYGPETTFYDVNNDGLNDATYIDTPATFQGSINKQGNGFTLPVVGVYVSPVTSVAIPSAPHGYMGAASGVYKTFADVNGDGLRDLLYRHFDPLASPRLTDFWHLRLGNGNSLSALEYFSGAGNEPSVEYFSAAIDTEFPIARIPITSGSYAPHAEYSYSYDYNKDGFDDVIFLKYIPALNDMRWNLFYSSYQNGTVKLVDSGIDPFNNRAYGIAHQLLDTPMSDIFYGDVNNDGLMDAVFYENAYETTSSGIVYFAAKQQQPDLINKITDGFGAETKIDYSPLTGDTNNGKPLYTPDTVAPVFPQQPVNRGAQVVKKISTSNGLGGFNHTYFNYTGGVQDVFRGFSGFKSIAITNTAANVTSTTEYRQDWPYTGRIKKQTVKDTSGKLISITDNSYAVHAQNARFPYLDYSLQKNYALSTTSENSPLGVSKTINTFNACGNLTEQTASVGSGFSGANITGELSNQMTVNVYDENSTPDCHDDFRTSTTQTVAKTGSNDLKTVVTEFTANAQRDLETRTDFKGESIQVTIAYERETNGVVNKTTETAKDIDGTNEPARVTTLSNFVDGMYPQTITNAEGHVTSITYDKRFGSVATQTFLGLTTTNTYDALGRVQQQQTADGTTTENRAFYCSSAPVTCPTGAYYGVASRVTNSNPAQVGKLGEPLSITFYDALQREVRSVVYSLDGKVINQASEYTANGYLTRVSEPYATTGIVADTAFATAWTNYSNYDALGRANSIVAADGGSKTTTYSTDGYGFKTSENILVIKPGGSSETQTTNSWINSLGQVTRVEDALLNTVSYAYDSAGNLETTQVNNNVVTNIDILHDLAGNKTYIKDPDAGIIHFDYNGFGELRKQTWQKNVAGVEKYITYDYDKLGRQTSRVDKPASGSNVTYSWVWDTKQQGQLSSRSGNGFSEEYFYDGFSRLSRQIVTTTGLSGGEFIYTYDNFSRPVTMQYPNGFKIERHYHADGYQVKTNNITDSANPKVLWALGNTIDARGAFNNQLWGNGVVTQTAFDANNGRLSSIKSGRLSSNNSFTNLYGDIQNLSYTFDSLGNLRSRTTARTDNNGLSRESITEAYGYDKLNRVTTSTTSGLFGRTQSYQYDSGGLGNLVNRSDVLTGSSINNDVGELKYEQVRNAGVHAVTSANGTNYSYDKYGNMIARGSESIIYDTFNKPTRITGASITDFYYDPDHELYKEISGTKTTYKLAGGMYEVIVDGTTTTQKSYVDGVILNNRTLTNGTQSANETLYLHTDHLGSVEATTNALGQFVNRMSFGAWGERQKSDSKPGNPTESFLTSNGFTGHDQLDNHNLVHMGGRVYDPALGRFLSADLYIQSPYNSQSFNRYNYTFNNPLSYTDPTGYASELFNYFVNQTFQQSSAAMWSSEASYLKTERTLWWGNTKGMDDYHYWWKTDTSTVNSVDAGSIYQSVSYNVPSWGTGPFRVYNFEPGFRQQCGGDAQCMQTMRIDEAKLQLGTMSLAVGGEVGIVGKAMWEARTARIAAEKLAKALNVPGRVQSRINVSNEGWAHVLKRHFSGKTNASQFSVGKDELKSLLQSKQVVGSPITRTIESADGLRYVREINMGRNIGVDAMKGNSNTSIMTTMSDKYGNLITAFPGVLK